MLDRILIGSSAEPSDPDFENVTLLLHGDGSNGAQNNTFIDSSTNNFTITRNGNTTQGSFSPYGSNWSNYFDGSGDYLTSTSADTANAMGTGDWTVEGWVYRTSSASDMMIFDTLGVSAGSADYIRIFLNSAGTISLYRYSTAVTTTTSSIPVGTWAHIAVVRQSGAVKIYINGTQGNTTYTDTGVNYTCSANRPVIGINGFDNSSNPFSGYISNIRAVKGTAVYTANFTPPTQLLTAITNTSLLTCAYNRFRDGSTNNFTITRNGDVKVTNFAPFAPSSAYSTTTNGGSAYFDGSGDYLSAPSNAAFAFGTGDFTLECWAYLDGNPGVITGIFDTRNSSSSSGGILCQIDQDFSNALRVEIGGSQVFLTSQTVPLRQWNHIAIVRSSGTVKAYLNGSAMTGGSAANSTNITDTNMRWGGDRYGYYVYGYISNARVVNGTAVYTANFTPPSSPVTAITNTSLLLNATNAAIFDNSMKNDLETVGNAQISTSVKKFGTGSIYLDGSGDWLTCATTDVNKFGSGDFTIEGWIYRNNSSDGGFYSDRVASPDYSGMVIYIKSDKVAMLVSTNGSSWGLNTVAATEGNSVPTTAWSHLAITRSGSTWRVFIDGTLSYSKTLSGSVSQTQSVAYIGADIPDGKYLNGYIDDLRITKGVARYTANFTAPTAPFPNK